jgi:hypothetical protein
VFTEKKIRDKNGNPGGEKETRRMGKEIFQKHKQNTGYQKNTNTSPKTKIFFFLLFWLRELLLDPQKPQNVLNYSDYKIRKHCFRNKNIGVGMRKDHFKSYVS